MDDTIATPAHHFHSHRKRCWCEAAVIAAASLIALVSARDYAGGWNDGSRLATVESLVDYHTLAIDQSIFVRSPNNADAPNPYTPGDELLRAKGTQDKLLIAGHYYSDKSPLPAFWLAGWYGLLQRLTGLTAREQPNFFCYLMTVLSSGIAYVISVWAVWRLGVRHRLPLATCVLLAASLGFATVALPYTRQVNNHILLLVVVSLLMLALDRPGVAYAAVRHTAENTLPQEALGGRAAPALRDGEAGDSKVASALRDGEAVAKGDRQLRHGVSELPCGGRVFPAACLPGTLAGLGYTLDLGLGPMLVLCTAALVAYRTCSLFAIACFGLAAAPWLAAHHVVNYITGGTFGPANSVAAYLAWPGSPFSVQNMTGGWAHRDFGHFLLYAAALLFGKHGLLNYNLPLFLALSSLAILIRRRLAELPEIVFATAFCGAAWLLYAALSNNYSGPCCSIRWFVPFLAPGYYVLVLMLRERRETSCSLQWLTGCGACLVSLLWWRGPWDGSVPYLLWPLNVIALVLLARQRPAPVEDASAPEDATRRQAA